MNEYSTARTTMVDCQVRPADVNDHAVIAAMLEIPREQFLNETHKSLAYIDEDIPLGISTNGYPRYLMEPASFAKLLQLAQIEREAIVLDVGCATGYSTAVLARLCSSLVALEEDDKLAALAGDNLAGLEIDNSVVVSGPLVEGFAREGPFDVIFVGGAVDYVPDKLIEQLKDGGNLVAVVGKGNCAVATKFIREGNTVGKSVHFNCSVKPLPGFSRLTEFVF